MFGLSTAGIFHLCLYEAYVHEEQSLGNNRRADLDPSVSELEITLIIKMDTGVICSLWREQTLLTFAIFSLHFWWTQIWFTD